MLCLVKEYSSSYVPKTSLPEFPQLLTSLYNLKLKYYKLLEKCESMYVTPNMASTVEKASKEQMKSPYGSNIMQGG